MSPAGVVKERFPCQRAEEPAARSRAEPSRAEPSRVLGRGSRSEVPYRGRCDRCPGTHRAKRAYRHRRPSGTTPWCLQHHECGVAQGAGFSEERHVGYKSLVIHARRVRSKPIDLCQARRALRTAAYPLQPAVPCTARLLTRKSMAPDPVGTLRLPREGVCALPHTQTPTVLLADANLPSRSHQDRRQVVERTDSRGNG